MNENRILPKISLCTTCHGTEYFEFLKETLPKNLDNNPEENVEFVILAYGDKDVYNWVRDNFKPEIESGRIKLAYSEQDCFRMAHAKNMAHRLAGGDVLVNLDADNVTGRGFAAWATEKFLEHPDTVVRYTPFQNRIRRLTGVDPTSIGGRIAVSANNFLRMHGYDEKKHNGYTGDDDNFLARAVEMGLRHIDPTYKYLGTAIHHKNEVRLSGLCEDEKEKSAQHFVERAQNNSFRDKLERKITKVSQILGVMEKTRTPLVDSLGNFGCGEVKILKRDFTEKVQTLSPQPHPLWGMSLHSEKVRDALDWRKLPTTGYER